MLLQHSILILCQNGDINFEVVEWQLNEIGKIWMLIFKRLSKKLIKNKRDIQMSNRINYRI